MCTRSSLRNFLPIFAGILFAVAWWVWIDSHVYVTSSFYLSTETPISHTITFVHYIPGLVATLGLIMTNLVSLENVNPTSWMFDPEISSKIRFWLFASFIVSFAAVGGAMWILAAQFLPAHNNGSQYPGIALAVQTVLIFASSVIYLGSKTINPEEYEYGSL
eukprot:TRINITY_DN6325_c0_g1_i1.p1 TRINITY_DN6325_c0_g1~~TRINITY_DN6325_c0_g1_i1.p1  ORF type:complete len:162 (+),score=45.35 TRINITY_DN6325_c0_g1_i1:145-630(+)